MIDCHAIIRSHLRDCIKEILQQVANESNEYGLPVSGAFYLSIDMTHPLITVPMWLRKQYPEELTIVLQEQFWGLQVNDDGFSVILSFGGSQDTVSAAYEAILWVAEPQQQFGFRFQRDEHVINPSDDADNRDNVIEFKKRIN